jgi:parvulin-like peptidyl-prolyl isomerase
MPKHISKTGFILLLLFCLCRSSLSYAEVVDKILVIVNDEIITRGDLDRLLLPVYVQYKSRYSDRELKEKIDEVRRNLLKRLIEDKLLLVEARKREIEVASGEVEERIREVRVRFSTEEEFEAALAQENMLKSDLKEKFKEKIMIEKFVASETQAKISVSPNELFNYYKTHTSEFVEPPKVKLRAILIRIKKGRSQTKALKLAQKILYRLEQGGDFSLLAEEYSEGPYADSKGDMGWVEEGQLMDRINDLIFQMDAGDISGILKTDLGFHIFKVEGKRQSRTKGFAEEKRRIEDLLYGKKRQDALRQLIEELRENAYIAFR